MARSRSPHRAAGPRAGVATDVVLQFGEGKDADDVMHAHSAVLRVASPVIDAMFEAGMQEKQLMKIPINAEVASKKEFEEFYELLLPFGPWDFQLGAANIKHMFRISDYFQVERLRCKCVEYLRSASAAVDLLVFAHKHGLKDVYARMLGQVSSVTKDELAPAKDSPEVALDIAAALSSKLGGLQTHVDELRNNTKQSPPYCSFEDKLKRLENKVKTFLERVPDARARK
mmetsp:Transcript_21979/g.65556  ORF Transcript_21979/g.65556 Transcript_21979/m.65556 type:complete len:229 (-) Transcript_21979:178-864(-)